MQTVLPVFFFVSANGLFLFFAVFADGTWPFYLLQLVDGQCRTPRWTCWMQTVFPGILHVLGRECKVVLREYLLCFYAKLVTSLLTLVSKQRFTSPRRAVLGMADASPELKTTSIAHVSEPLLCLF